MSPRRLPDTDIYAVLSSMHSLGRNNIETARQLLEAGIKIIQYREKNFSSYQKHQECQDIRRLCRRHNACFIINDDAELAVASDADGLHLGPNDLPPEAARHLIGPDKIIGFSATTTDEIDTALSAANIDYLGVGPVFYTNTKCDAAEPGGISLLDYALRHSRLPVVAIGGIKAENIPELVRLGTCYMAMVSELVSAPDIPQKVTTIRAIIKAAKRQ